MDFLSRMTRSPRPYDAEDAAELRPLFAEDLPDTLADLVAAAGACSPYLKTLAGSERTWLPDALAAPESAFDRLLDDLRAADANALPVALRRTKRRAALLTALADLAGVWPLETVTGTLTRLADLACDLALRATLAPELRRGRLPGMDAGDLDTACGMVVLAMGKMGAHELNYSSDIDLICLYDETRFAESDQHEARAAFVRATRRFTAMLSDRTAEGYVFRTDLRLRPDPAVTPVCLAMAAAETYYESLGRTWERAAYVKARACAGDTAAGQRFLDTLRPFVWRRHLDFTAIQDAHSMRLAIRSHKRLHGPITLPGHDMKLGRGGIREIEFFTQTRQIIAGGRDPELRVRGTLNGLARLAERGWVPEDVAAMLGENYRIFREVEHRLQMLRDAQTHSLPTDDEGFARLAASMDREPADLQADLMARLSEVHGLIENFFASDAPGAGKSADTTGAGVEVPEDVLDPAIIAAWPGYPALRSARAVEIFNRLRPEILSRLAQSAHPSEALLAFDGFLAGLPAGVQIFALFEANPHLIDLLVDIVGTAPRLARHLARNPQVFDAVIAGDFFAPWPGRAALQADLARRLAHEVDYEARLDTARRWAREWRFRVGVHHLRGLIGAFDAAQEYADLADAVLGALWPVVVAQFAGRHGAPPGRGAAVLGMGSLGAGRLSAGSDLDLIIIYDPAGQEDSDGRRPLAARPYYARLTKALIAALSAPMAEGRLYEVDMRLRPSGHQGPVATAWDTFRSYQRDEAWTWEHLALTRARAIAGADDLAAEIETFRHDLLAAKGTHAAVLGAVADMRRRIRDAKTPAGPWDAKLGPGRLQEIELLAQAGTLLAGSAARDTGAGLENAVVTGILDAAHERALRAAHVLCWRLHMAARLLDVPAADPEVIGAGGRAFVLRETGHDSAEALRRDLDACTERAAAMIDAALAGTSDAAQEG